jgi:urate oxidase
VISYGKEAVSVYRTDGVGSLFAAEVAIEVFGETFMPAYTDGDNSLVVATDTMKNFVHATALGYEHTELEGFLVLLGERFLATYGHVERLAVRGRELPFERRGPVLFQRLDGDYGVAEVELDRSGLLTHRSGRRGIKLIKLTGSSFADFPRDGFTTLPERVDRPLYVHLDVHWRHADFARRVAGDRVRDSLASTFCAFVSSSIQNLVHEMGVRLLAAMPELAEVSFTAENRLWDTAQVAETDDRVRVYTDPRPPYGRITLTLPRATAGG